MADVTKLHLFIGHSHCQSMLMNSRIIKRLACVLVQTLGCKVQDKTIIDLLVRTASSVPDKVRCGEDGK